MKILGIDHGSHTGWALIEDGEYVTCGSFDVNGESKGRRFNNFLSEVKNLILEYSPDIIAVEKPVHKRGGDVTLFLSGLYTMAICAADCFNLPLKEVNPKSMKKKITSSGNADKDIVASYLSDLFKVPVHKIIEVDRCGRDIRKNGKLLHKKGDVFRTRYDKSDALGLAAYVWLTKEGDEENE